MMKSTKFIILLASLALWQNSMKSETLWYKTPANEWMEALPVGNGRLGGMVHGGVTTERIALNESTLWSGGVNPNQNKPFGKERLDSLRQLFFNGQIAEGNSIAWHELVGDETDFGSHVPLGDLKIQFHYDVPVEVKDYRRSLSLDEAVADVSYTVGKVRYLREYLCSHPQQVLAARYTASRRGQLSMELSMELLRPEAQVEIVGNRLVATGIASQPGRTNKGVRFVAIVEVEAKGGTVVAGEHSLQVSDADEVVLYADMRTDYRNEECRELCERTLSDAAARTFREIRKEHVADYAPLFGRTALQLGDRKMETVPTDQRWRMVRQGGDDPALQALFFQYGRYLTIVSSREDSPLPIALQGFFNDNLACNMGWNNDYHLDINTEQNYWLANVGNLAECNMPLFRYISDLAQAGRATAETVYGCQGWTAHCTANVWGFTALAGCIAWGLHPTGGSWMATHLWNHFLYTRDIDFLRDTAYPLLKGNGRFLLDYLCEDPATGYLVTGPSISPENSFGWNGQSHSASMMPTIDLVLTREILQACAESTELLGCDESFGDSVRQALDKLPPFHINKYGGLCEWLEDYDDINVNHRHTSHLLSVYPYGQISLQHTPELAQAAYNTIQRRITAEGWEDVEWSRAWAVCNFARLQHVEEAYQSLNMLIGKLGRENLFTVSPKGIAGAPWDIFAIDGNMAGAAGVAEMLVQSHAGFVDFLPSVPSEWREGKYSGLCVQGAAEVSAEWKTKNGTLSGTMRLKKTGSDGEMTIRVPQGVKSVKVNGRRRRIQTDADSLLTVHLAKGDEIVMKR